MKCILEHIGLAFAIYLCVVGGIGVALGYAIDLMRRDEPDEPTSLTNRQT